MEPQARYITPESQCPYLPDQQWQLEYLIFRALDPALYWQFLNRGWRRAGPTVFHPVCSLCNACQSVRVLVDHFKPNRSQRRVAKLNAKQIDLAIVTPSITDETVELYMRHHAHHSATKAWPTTSEYDAYMHLTSLTESPYPTQQWQYRLDEKLVAAAWIDPLPDGLSGVYFVLDPQHSRRSLGTWIVLTMIARCKELGLPYAYLGYYVAGCRSMEYKARFIPNQALGPDGQWHGLKD